MSWSLRRPGIAVITLIFVTLTIIMVFIPIGHYQDHYVAELVVAFQFLLFLETIKLQRSMIYLYVMEP